MKRLILFLTWAALLPACALTLVNREPFQGVGTLNSTTPGNLGTVSGSFYKRAVGPRLNSDTTANKEGWSADVHMSVGNTSTQATDTNFSDGKAYCADMWFNASSNIPANSTSPVTLMYLTIPSTTQPLYGVSLGTSTGSLVLTTSQYGGGTPTGTYFATANLSLNTWYEVRLAWRPNTSGGSNDPYFYSVLYRKAGVPGFTDMYDYNSTAGIAQGAAINSVVMGAYSALASSTANLRVGMPSLYQLSSWADRTTLVPDVADPPSGPFTWYVNPSTGNDNNDGTGTLTPWASVTKINQESANMGMFPTTAGYANGDTLIIDTTKANLVLGSNSLNLMTQGLTVTQLGGGLTGTGEIQAWQQLSPSSWSGPISGTSHVYQTTLTSQDADCVLWQNDLWLNHVTGTSLSAVQASLDSTAGSFWTNGTTLYCHPFGNSNPTSDGNVYTRSYNRGGTGDGAVMIGAPDMHLNGLRVRKTCLDDETHNPIAAYCYQTIGAAGGNSLFENCYGAYGSKHIFGYTDNSLTRTYTTRNCQAEQGSPYVAAGGQSPWVDYANNSGSNGTAVSHYLDCVTLANTGLVDSTAGQTRLDIPCWLCHNSGTGSLQFAEVDFTNCQLSGPLVSYNAVSAVSFTSGSCSGGTFSAPTTATINATKVTAGEMFSGGTTLQVLNSIIAPATMNGGFVPNISGTVAYEGCTIDLSSTTSNIAGSALFNRSSSLEFTWRNNLLIGSTANTNNSVLQGATNTDQLNFDHNAYENISIIVTGYVTGSQTANKSLAQWQALGFDASSFTTTNPLLTNYFPGKGSPLINTGANLVIANPPTNIDFSTTVYPYRTTIGAYEDDAFLTAQTISNLPTTQTLTLGPSNAPVKINLPADTSAGLPITYTVSGQGASITNDVLTLTGPGVYLLSGVQPGNSTIGYVRAVDTITIPGATATDTPTMPWIGLLALGGLLVYLGSSASRSANAGAKEPLT